MMNFNKRNIFVIVGIIWYEIILYDSLYQTDQI